jgi:hypothetical protein
MIVEIAMPELTLYPRGFPDYWLNMIFRGTLPNDYKTKALLATYIRLVEASYTHYRLARRYVQEFWNDHSSFQIDSANFSATHFEDCINSMNRAVLFMRQIRSSRDVPTDLKSLFPKKPVFTTEAVAKSLRDVRNTIQHMDKRILDRTIADDASFTLMATGTETLIPNQPDQTRKVIDRLVVGSHTILFAELVPWLHEMGACAEAISKYVRVNGGQP